MGKIIKKQVVKILLCIVMPVALLLGCAQNSEQAAYEEVLSTLSLQKLASFLETYPDSNYGDLLINEFLARCDAELDSKGCYGMLLKVIPGNNSRFDMVAKKYDRIK